MALTYIGLKKDNIEHVRTVCDGIHAADVTFQFKIVKSSLPEYDKLLMVKSESIDQAHKRGTWLVNKLGIDGLLYWVKTGDN